MVQNNAHMQTIDLFSDFQPALPVKQAAETAKRMPINVSRNPSCLWCGKTFNYTFFNSWSTLKSVLYCDADHKHNYLTKAEQDQ